MKYVHFTAPARSRREEAYADAMRSEDCMPLPMLPAARG